MDLEYRGVLKCVVCHDCEGSSDACWVALDCGHVLHYVCYERVKSYQSQCPTCRKPLNKRKEPVKLYVDNAPCNEGGSMGGEVEVDAAVANLRQKISEQQCTHQQLQGLLEQARADLDKAKKQKEEWAQKRDEYKSKIMNEKIALRQVQDSAAKVEAELRDRIRRLEGRISELEREKSEAYKARESAEHRAAQLNAMNLRLEGKLKCAQVMKNPASASTADLGNAAREDLLTLTAHQSEQISSLKQQLEDEKAARAREAVEAKAAAAAVERAAKVAVDEAKAACVKARREVNKLEYENLKMHEQLAQHEGGGNPMRVAAAPLNPGHPASARPGPAPSAMARSEPNRPSSKQQAGSQQRQQYQALQAARGQDCDGGLLELAELIQDPRDVGPGNGHGTPVVDARVEPEVMEIEDDEDDVVPSLPGSVSFFRQHSMAAQHPTTAAAAAVPAAKGSDAVTFAAGAQAFGMGGTNAVGGGNLGIVAGAGACSALPAAPAASSLMAPSRPKSFMGGAVSSNMQGSTGLLVREGPDGRGGITRHLQPSAINVATFSSATYKAAPRPNAVQPAAKKMKQTTQQTKLTAFVFKT